ncbi:MAG: hypothetical protein FHK80_08615 [Azoarcus sp. PHD]|nr:MAG: hypothetical protein FHK80_08615 [Azoarcus sp. PHD]
MCNTAAVILSHNHLSGNPEPSEADKALRPCSSRVPWRLLDHVCHGCRRQRGHAWHPRPLGYGHRQFGHPVQGRHGADRAQDGGDAHALRPHRRQPGA